MSVTREEMARAMRECREGVGLSRRALEKLSGVNQSTIISWELGRATPSADALVLVCEAMGIGLDVYLGLQPRPKKFLREGGRPTGEWKEIVCFARDPEAVELVRPLIYLCSHCGRMQYTRTEVCCCGARMGE